TPRHSRSTAGRSRRRSPSTAAATSSAAAVSSGSKERGTRRGWSCWSFRPWSRRAAGTTPRTTAAPGRSGCVARWPTSSSWKGSDVYYERRGRGASDAPAVLSLHGLGSSPDDWTWQVPAFEPAHRLLLVDPPGPSRSPLPGARLSVDGMAESVAGLLARLGEPPAHVVGLSLGGCVGLALAL